MNSKGTILTRNMLTYHGLSNDTGNMLSVRQSNGFSNNSTHTSRLHIAARPFLPAALLQLLLQSAERTCNENLNKHDYWVLQQQPQQQQQRQL